MARTVSSGNIRYAFVSQYANADIMDSFNIDHQRIMQWSNNLRIQTESVVAINFIQTELMIVFNKSAFGIAELNCADIGIKAGSIEVINNRLQLRAVHHGDGVYKLDILIRKVVHFVLEFQTGKATDVANQYGHEYRQRCTRFYCNVNSKYRLARVNDL